METKNAILTSSIFSNISIQQDDLAILSEHGIHLSFKHTRQLIYLLIEALVGAGIQKSHRVSTIIPNGTLCSLLMLAVIDAAIACPLASTCTQDEYKNQLTVLQADILICTSSDASRFKDLCQDLNVCIISVDIDFESPGVRLSVHNGERLKEQPIKKEERLIDPARQPSLILLTSGSTGRPKRVALTRANILHSAKEVGTSVELGRGDMCLSMWEQYHIGGVVDVLIAPLLAGSSIRMTTGFSLSNFRAAFKVADITWLQCVPTTLREIIRCIKTEEITIPQNLRFIRSVASQLPTSLHLEAESVLGVPIVQTYGMTEASPLITTNRLLPGFYKVGTVGKPLSTEIMICPVQMDERYNEKAIKEGEILIRGDNVITNYDDPSGETASCFSEGWFKTGDLGFFDQDGFLVLTGRVKAIINRGGEKISPLEIESAAIGICGVERALAFPIPHKTLGAAVGLVVSGQQLNKTSNLDQLHSTLALKLSANKIPSKIWVVDTIPSTTTGKLLQEAADAIIKSLLNSNEVLRQSAGEETGFDAISADPLYDYLVKLWKAEIDVQIVGLDDDFEALGGDSLSSLRVVSQIERDFGIHIPLSSIAGLRTVRKLASFINGLKAETSTNIKTGGRSYGIGHQAGESDAELDPHQIELMLLSSKSISDTRRYIELFLNKLTLGEIIPLLARLMSHDRFVCNAGISDQWSAEIARWNSEIQREVRLHPDSLFWTRTNLGLNAQLFSSNSRACSSKTLIVGFTGNQMRLMLPIYIILSSIDSQKYDLLLLQDPSRSHYSFGVRDISGSLPKLAKWLKDYTQVSGYNDIISFGTSAGALAAVLVGIMNRWSRSIGIGAEKPSVHPQLADHIAKLSSDNKKPENQSCILLFDPSNQRDAEGALEIKSYLKDAKLLNIKAGGAHNILYVLHKHGKLRQALISLLEK